MLEDAAFLFFRVVSAAACAWVLWVLLWMALDVMAVARTVVLSVRRSLAWPAADARVTADYPDSNVRNARIRVAFDLPGGGNVEAVLPKVAPYLWAPSVKGPQAFPRTMGRGLLSLVANRPFGGRVAVVFDPADPRRAEHRTGVALGAYAVASQAALLFFLAPFGLGLVAGLLEYVVLA